MTAPKPHRDYNVGASDYATHEIQVWDIWREYNLNALEGSIVKRLLRKKPGQRLEDLRKIIHEVTELIDWEEQNNAGLAPEESPHFKTTRS